MSPSVRHVRITGYRVDRRYRMGGMHTTKGGPTLCGAPEGFRDFDMANAKAIVHHARVLASRPEMSVHATAAELCPACVAAMGAA